MEPIDKLRKQLTVEENDDNLVHTKKKKRSRKRQEARAMPVS